jgi:putative ABC transport system permease protein
MSPVPLINACIWLILISKALLLFLVRTRWSSIMTVLGVMLGITSIVAVHLVSQRVAQQLSELVPEPLAQFNFVALPETDANGGVLTSADFFQLRRQWLSDPSASANGMQNIAAVMPIIDESVLLGGQRMRVVGINFTQALDFEFTSDNPNDPKVRGESASTVDLWRGIVTGPDVPDVGLPVLGSIALPGVLIADIGTAQTILGWNESDRLSYIGVQVESPIVSYLEWLDELLPGASAGLPDLDAPQLQGFNVQPGVVQHPAVRFGDAVLFNVSALSMLALVVAWFLIYQVAVSWARRLSGVLSRLYVLGVTQQRLRAYFVGLLLVVGLVAAAVGLVVGWYLASVLLSASLGVQISSKIDAWIVLKAFGSSIVVCGFGGAWAFRQTVSASATAVSLKWQILAVLLMSAVVAIGLLVPATDLAGAFLSIAVLSVFMTFLMTPALQLAKRASRWLGGSVLLRTGLREAIWYPRDLSVALAGLGLAIATAIGVGLMVDSFRADFQTMLDQRLSYDYAVQGSEKELRALYRRALDDPGVSRVRGYRESDLRIAGLPFRLIETEVDAIEARRFGYEYALGPNEVLVSEQLKLGEISTQIEIREIGEQPASHQVVGSYKGFGDMLPTVVRSQAHATTITSVRLNAELETANNLMQAFSDSQWRDQKKAYTQALLTFDRTFLITSILIALAVGVGGIGVYIAITHLRLNQRGREQLMAFLGLSRFEIFGLDLARGIGVGLAASLIAVPLGIVFGWILCEVVNPRAFGWRVDLKLSFAAIFIPVGWGLLAGVFAGLVRLGRHEMVLGDA